MRRKAIRNFDGALHQIHASHRLLWPLATPLGSGTLYHMIDFQIGIEEPGNDKCSEPDRLRIRLGDACLTRLVRHGSHEPDDWLEAPPVPLAFWFIDNWWRIRWEPAPTQTSTRSGDLHITYRLSGLDTIGPTCRSGAKVHELGSLFTPTPTTCNLP